MILREPGEPPRVVHDHHVLGLFPRDVWLRLLREAGARAEGRRRAEHPYPGEYELFLALRARA